MTATEEFQSRHGERWAHVVNDPSFTDALLTVNVGLLDKIKQLTPEQTASPMGNIMLARLQGALDHERELIALSILLPDISSSDLGQETYKNEFEENGELPSNEEEPPTRVKRKYTRKKK